MRLIKRLLELAFVILVISLFMKNKDVVMEINYFGLTEPLRIAFWELVTFCVSIGIIIAAFGDFITQLKWVGEKRRLIRADKEHQGEVSRLNDTIGKLEKENQQLKKDLDQTKREVADLKSKGAMAISVKPAADSQVQKTSSLLGSEKPKEPTE